MQCYKVHGIKGFPILSLHPPFNLVKGMTIDDLHCIDLGVAFCLLALWFSSDNRGKPLNIYDKVIHIHISCNVNLISICM